MQPAIEELFAKILGSAPTVETFRDNTRVLIPAEKLIETLTELKSTGFNMLCDLAGIDYLNYPETTDRFGVIYSLTNIATGDRLFIKTFVNDPDPELPSVFNLWAGADWMEREIFDLFGINFIGHPNMKRILMPEAFEGHPLRKDYPLRGYGERHNLPVLTRAES